MNRFLIITLFVLVGCKSVSIQNETYIKTTQQLELGGVGENKLFILEEDYNRTAFPIITKPIKISANVLPFNKASYKVFVKANSNIKKNQEVSYEDSSSVKPKFLKLEIADRVTVLNLLNDKVNEAVKGYILNKKDAHIISAISIAFDDEILKTITEAEALFLEQDGNKQYVIKVIGKSKTEKISLKEGVVFAYQASNFCWQENDRHQLEIVDIVETTDKCPNRTYRNAKQAKEKVDYFKL